MTKMKKILLVAIVSFISATTFAQTSFGVKAGTNFSSVKTSDAELNSELKTRTTFHFGGFANIGLSKSFAFQPQLFFSGKGASIAHGNHSDEFNINALDIPLNFLYNTNGFFFGAGPNIGINLSGKFKTHENGIEEEEKLEFGSGSGQLKRVDIGANFTAGYQLKSGLLFSANYTAGLTNWSNVSSEKWRNNILGISVGYTFGKKK
jgi:hypothetical protein